MEKRTGLQTVIPSKMTGGEKDFKIMQNRPNPTASKAATRPSKVNRRFMCACYERCLDEAVRRK